MTTATVKGKALWQKTRQMLGRGYNSLTAKELQLARFLQQKIPAGYEITRIVILLIKIALIILLFMIALWLLFAVLAIIAVIAHITSPSDSESSHNNEGFCSNHYDYETPGTLEHIAANPDLYDSHGNFK